LSAFLDIHVLQYTVLHFRRDTL